MTTQWVVSGLMDRWMDKCVNKRIMRGGWEVNGFIGECMGAKKSRWEDNYINRFISILPFR